MGSTNTETISRVMKNYFIPFSVSAAAFGAWFVLRKFGIIYQLFHKADTKSKRNGGDLAGEVLKRAISKNFQSYVYRSRTLRFFGVLATPWVLPFDIVYIGVIRLLEYLPSLPQDVVYMYREIIDIIRGMSDRMTHRKRHYTARFSCQLAITEFNLNQDVPRNALLSSSPYEPKPTAPVVRKFKYRVCCRL